jgi:L-asparaginase
MKLLKNLFIAAGCIVCVTSHAVDLPLVYILGTGGTIQSKGDTRMTLHDYRAGRFDISELVEALPELQDIARIEAKQVTNIGSPSMTPVVWKELAETINALAAENPEIAGFVLTHGTNTLEETAWFLHLTVKTDRPVVVVGAQRPATAISGDGPMNLYNAVKVAASEDARNKGVMIAMNQQINSAREGTKTSAYKVEAFQSRDLGLLGVIDPDGVQFYREPTRRHTIFSEFSISEISEWPRVDVVESYAGAPGDIIEFLIRSGSKGIVLSGHGAGGSSPEQSTQFKAATDQGIIVIAASRTGSGRVIQGTRMEENGILAGDNLLPHKARILLQLALASGLDKPAIERILEQY